jgi:predicted phage tail protein
MRELTPVLLYGHLGKKFGRKHKYAVASPQEAIRAMCSTIPGFRDWLYAHAQDSFRVVVGRDAITANQLEEPVGPEPIKIIPMARGGKDDGDRILVGIALIIASRIPGLNVYAAQAMFSMGVSSVAGGVSGFLFAPPDPGVYGTDAENGSKSYLFGGANSQTEAGGPVPVLFGRRIVPPVLISGGIVPEVSGKQHFGLLGDGLGNWSGDGVTVPLAASIGA